MNTRNKNKLIADWIDQDFFEGKLVEECRYSKMKFHKDWNWLMFAVQEIARVLHWSINATLEFLSEDQDRDGLFDIEDVFDAVAKFIKNR